MTEFYSLITDGGLKKIETALMRNQKLNLKYMAVGDANNEEFTLKPNQTELINEKYRCEIQQLTSTSVNAHIPENIGGFYITEVGLFDSDGTLILVAKQPKTYKPVEKEGSVKRLWIKVIIEAINPKVLNIQIDPNVETASVQFVYETLMNHRHCDLMEIIKYDTNINGIVDTCEFIDGGKFNDGANIFEPLPPLSAIYMQTGTYDIDNNGLADYAENIDGGIIGNVSPIYVGSLHSYMLHSVYDKDNDGVIDHAENIDGGNFYNMKKEIIRTGESKVMNTIVYDKNNDGIVDEIDEIDAGTF